MSAREIFGLIKKKKNNIIGAIVVVTAFILIVWLGSASFYF
ncbi:MAG: hypothetical protein ACXADU_02905 [Promethearchaeota archaeon]|jgi:hypothetical protein